MVAFLENPAEARNVIPGRALGTLCQVILMEAEVEFSLPAPWIRCFELGTFSLIYGKRCWAVFPAYCHSSSGRGKNVWWSQGIEKRFNTLSFEVKTAGTWLHGRQVKLLDPPDIPPQRQRDMIHPEICGASCTNERLSRRQHCAHQLIMAHDE